jgi:AcrR family transcriptional regulator
MIKDETREQILSGALRVFSHRGYAATRVSDIAKACGLSHGLLYYYFQSKDEIFTELVRRAVESSSNALLMAEAIPAPAFQKIEWITREVLSNVMTDADSAYYFLIMTQTSVTDVLPDKIQAIMKQSSVPFDVMLRIVAEGQIQDSVVAGDVQQLVTAYWSAIQGIAIYRIAFKDNFQMPDADILLRMLRAV